jgi:hypothetical protein
MAQLLGIHLERGPPNPGDGKLDCRHAAIEGRTVVLDARGYADDLCLDVHHQGEQLIVAKRAAGPGGQRARDSHVHGRRPRDPRADGGVGSRMDVDTARAEDPDQACDQRQLFDAEFVRAGASTCSPVSSETSLSA